MDTTGLAFIGLAFFLVLAAMAGLGAGLLLRKKSPLRGTCRRAACDHGGPDEEGTCLCSGRGQDSPAPRR